MREDVRDLAATNRSRFPTRARSSPSTCRMASRERLPERSRARAGVHQATRGQAYEYLPITSEADLIANLRRQLEALNKIEFSDAEWERFFGELHRRRQRRHRREDRAHPGRPCPGPEA